MTVLNLDFETYSEADIKQCGAQYYARHPSTEALMLGWSIDDGPVSVWDIKNDGAEPPPELLAACLDSKVLIHAYNAQFERLILEHCMNMKLPPERFRCTMVRAYGLAFNGSLEMVSEQFNTRVNKDPEGMRLINKFSKPQPKNQNVARWTRENAPEDWAKFMEYCRQDVETERALWKKCAPYHFPEEEWDYYAIDQRINDRGVPIDRDFIEAAIKVSEVEKKRLKKEMQKIAPDLDNPNSGPQILDWLGENGCLLSDLKAETVATTLTRDVEDPRVLEMLTLKQQLAKTSVSKYGAFERVDAGDGRARGMFQFGGASRTMRWAGRIVQLQNLPRGGNTTKDPATGAEIILHGGHDMALALYDRPLDLLSDCIRAVIKAPEGQMMSVSDLSSIESVVLGWESDCKMINDCFAAGRDTYKEFATRMFNVHYDEVTKQMRTFCKPPILGGGYMLGADGLVGYAAGMGVQMTKEEAQMAVNKLRESWPEVVAFWDWCKKAVFHTTHTGQEYPGPHGLKTFAHGEFLCIRLPSGRNLYYYQPQVKPGRAPWGEIIDQFTYMGTNRHANNKWMRVSAHAGGITENITQAIARDVLCVWMKRAHEAGLNIFLHVHDEIGVLDAENRVEELNALIRKPISWAPGLNVNAAGYCAKRYKKD